MRELIKTGLARSEGFDLANSPEYKRRYGLRAQAYMDNSDLEEIERADRCKWRLHALSRR